ncbi:hypothetical protein H072_4948 [Dactylellina haptotyla CBS 200.50]|uniref:Extracellular membrane protein CFEM domain-containing protein n=1 Tax=Dactylellina haptotyla (strain CBS 200.50) TaxID=1284197 RepID=S8ADQ6_DACHA|nr:hypothetical protein H072_4948 [Dactylellina haptotyla CBS 200.50]
MHRSILFFLAARSALGQVTTAPPNGPLEYASMKANTEYILQRSCVKHCLWYNGENLRGVYYHDWDDVGGELDCGYAPLNGCYCNTKYSSSATSYFESCIPYYCGTTGDPGNLPSALSLYNAYCATANGNPTKPVPEPVTVAATSTSDSSSSETSASSSEPSSSMPEPSSTPASAGSSSTSTPAATAAAKDSTSGAPSPQETSASGGGMSKGAIIGAAVGGSIGGIVIIAGCVAAFLIHKRRSAGKEQPMGGIEGY